MGCVHRHLDLWSQRELDQVLIQGTEQNLRQLLGRQKKKKVLRGRSATDHTRLIHLCFCVAWHHRLLINLCSEQTNLSDWRRIQYGTSAALEGTGLFKHTWGRCKKKKKQPKNYAVKSKLKLIHLLLCYPFHGGVRGAGHQVREGLNPGQFFGSCLQTQRDSHSHHIKTYDLLVAKWMVSLNGRKLKHSLRQGNHLNGLQQRLPQEVTQLPRMYSIMSMQNLVTEAIQSTLAWTK